MKKIIATNKNGNLIAVSNFYYENGLGYQESDVAFKKLINDQPFNAHIIKETLNASKNVINTFIVEEASEDLITLSSKDGFGNIRYLEITK